MEDAACETVFRQHGHCRQRVCHLAHCHRAQGVELGNRPFDRAGVLVRSKLQARSDEMLHPWDESAATRDLTSQRAQFEMRVRVHQAGREHPENALDRKPRVPRKDVDRATDIEHLTARIDDDRRIDDGIRITGDDPASVQHAHGLCSRRLREPIVTHVAASGLEACRPNASLHGFGVHAEGRAGA